MRKGIFVSTDFKRVTTGKILAYIWLIVFFLEFWAPATSGSTLSGNTFKYIMKLIYFALPVVIMIATILYRRAGLSSTNYMLAVTPVIYCMIHKLWVYSGSSGSFSTMLITVLFALQTDEIKSQSYKLIKNLFVFMSLIGIICYISYYFNLRIPYETRPYYSSLKEDVYYINYYVCYFYQNAIQIRLCGLFNEPGWFGTFLAFYLCSENLNLRNVKNIIVLIAGILTFSLAFYILLLLYYLLINIGNWKKWIWILMLPVVYIIIIPNLQTGNAVIDSFVNRISIDNIIHSIQNARTSTAFDNLYNTVMQGEAIFWGFGSGYSSIAGGDNLSIKVDLLEFGFMGVTVLYLPILLILFYKVKENQKAICFLICIAASLYQRPWIFEASNFILTVSAISYLLCEHQKRSVVRTNQLILSE